jgi:hypothetical protein
MNNRSNAPKNSINKGYPTELLILEQNIANTENAISNATRANKQGAGVNVTNLRAKLKNLENKYKQKMASYMRG